MANEKREMVRVTSDDYGRMQVLTGSGQQVFGIRKMTLTARPQAPVFAEMDLYVGALDLDAIPRLVVADPRTGQRKMIRRIEYLDGSTFDMDQFMPVVADDAERER